jgi:hypothetical protein
MEKILLVVFGPDQSICEKLAKMINPDLVSLTIIQFYSLEPSHELIQSVRAFEGKKGLVLTGIVPPKVVQFSSIFDFTWDNL